MGFWNNLWNASSPSQENIMFKGASLLGMGDSALAYKGAIEQNQSNERLAQEQREWNEAMWGKQNVYNDPASQMQRLTNAGLNPRLIYGQSSGSAAGNAGDVKGYDRAEARNVMEGFHGFSDMVRFRNTEAQTDNVKAQEQNINQDTILKAQEVLNRTIDGKQKGLDYGLNKATYEHSIKLAESNARNALNNADRSGIEADVARRTADTRVQRELETLQKVIEDTEGSRLQNELHRKSLELRKMGVNEGDHIIVRALIQSGKLQEADQFMRNLKNNKWFQNETFTKPFKD